jgi:hypothetical protein
LINRRIMTIRCNGRLVKCPIAELTFVNRQLRDSRSESCMSTGQGSYKAGHFNPATRTFCRISSNSHVSMKSFKQVWHPHGSSFQHSAHLLSLKSAESTGLEIFQNSTSLAKKGSGLGQLVLCCDKLAYASNNGFALA